MRRRDESRMLVLPFHEASPRVNALSFDVHYVGRHAAHIYLFKRLLAVADANISVRFDA